MAANTFCLRIADLCVEVTAEDPYTAKYCRAYQTDDTSPALSVRATHEDILHELALTPTRSSGYTEFICIYRSLAEQLPRFARMVVHGAVITYKEDAYMFCAPSGTGKTTHIRQWKKYLGTAVDIVNGDKPILHIADGHVTAFGTPWAGKENWQKTAVQPCGEFACCGRGRKTASAGSDLRRRRCIC